MTTTTIYEYVTQDGSETVHLIVQTSYFADSLVTLCGRPMVGDWSIGDETPSGIAATCGRCRRIAKLPKGGQS